MAAETYYNLHDALMGGPGLDGYAYCADVYCIPCGQDIACDVFDALGDGLGEVGELSFRDSETVPQPIFFGESDHRQHCANCTAYLYGEDDDS